MLWSLKATTDFVKSHGAYPSDDDIARDQHWFMGVWDDISIIQNAAYTEYVGYPTSRACSAHR